MGCSDGSLDDMNLPYNITFQQSQGLMDTSASHSSIHVNPRLGLGVLKLRAEFYTRPTLVRNWIIWHEIGHKVCGRSERRADWFAYSRLGVGALLSMEYLSNEFPEVKTRLGILRQMIFYCSGCTACMDQKSKTRKG